MMCFIRQVLLCFIAGSLFQLNGIERAHGQSQPEPPPGTQAPENLSKAFRRAIEPVLPAMVTIEVLRGPRTMPSRPDGDSAILSDRASHNSRELQHDQSISHRDDGTGSGVIIDGRGFILTCSHVVASADSVFVRLRDGRRYEAIGVMSDPATDVAVLQIASDQQLEAAPLGNSEALKIGDWVVSIGNPYNLGISVSAGIVSATDRHLPDAPRTHLIQTDAGSNPGNSGGALVNLQGQVVGICEGGYGMREGFQGIGLAIPIKAANEIAMRLVEEGEVPHVRLGFDTQPLEHDMASYLGLADAGGLLVSDVVPDSPAEQAGVKLGDVVTQVGSTPVRNQCDFLTALDQAVPGNPMRLAVFREGKNVDLEILPDRLADTGGSGTEDMPDEIQQKSIGHLDPQFGLTVDGASAPEMQKLGYGEGREGVVIKNVSPRSIAAKQAICSGMVVLRVGDKPITSLAEYRRAMADVTVEEGILVLIGTPQDKFFVLFQK